MNIENLDNKSFLEILLKNKELLKDEKIRNQLMDDKYHYTFVWLVQILDDYSYIADDDMVNKIINNNRCTDKLNAIMTSGKDNSPYIKNEKILKKIFENGLQTFLSSLNYDSSILVINYMIKNNLESNFRNFTPEIKYKLLCNENIKEELLNSKELKNILKGLDQKNFDILIKNEKCKNIILNSDIDYIANFISANISFPPELYNDYRFKKIFLDINDISTYRKKIDKLEINNGMIADEIDKKRFKNYDAIIDDYIDGYSHLSRQIISNMEKNKNYDTLINDQIKQFINKKEIEYLKQNPSSNIFSTNNENNLKKYLYEYDKNNFKEILIDRFFKDIPYNFLKNLKVMMDYNKTINTTILNERKSIYEKILNFDNLSFPEIKKLYEECKKIPNLSELFYEDYRNMKNNSYTNLISSAINPNNLSLKKSNEYGIPIYELNGEKFFAFVHVTSASREDVYNPNIWVENNKEGLSLSYIGSDNIVTFSDPFENIVFGFSNLDYNRIVHLRNDDSFSSYNSNYKDASRYVQKMYTPQNLIDNTNRYNEIVYQEKNKNIPQEKVKPDYIVCYDDIKEGDLKVAMNYNLPIVLVDTKKYKFKYGTLPIDEEDKYKM